MKFVKRTYPAHASYRVMHCDVGNTALVEMPLHQTFRSQLAVIHVRCLCQLMLKIHFTLLKSDYRSTVGPIRGALYHETIGRGWKLPCSSLILPDRYRVNSGIYMEYSHPCTGFHHFTIQGQESTRIG